MQNQWYIARDGKQYGPVGDAELEQLVRNRELLDGDHLWRHGYESWMPAAQVAEVRQIASQGAGRHVPPQHNPAPEWPGQGPGHNAGPKDETQRAAHFGQNGHGADAGAVQAGITDQPEQTLQPAPQQFGEEGALYDDPARNDLVHDERAHDEQAFDQQAFDEKGRTARLQNDQARFQPYADSGPDEAISFDARRDELRRSMDQQTDAGFRPDNFGHASPHDAVQGADHQREAMANHAPGAAELQDADLGGQGEQDLEVVKDASFTAQPDVSPDLQGQDPYGGNDMPMSMRGAQPGYEPQTGRQQPAYEAEATGGKASSFKVTWPLGLGIAAAFILVLLVGATFALPFIVPPETVKAQISKALKSQSGRDVSFKGKMSYRFLPSFGLDLNNIVIHNPPNIKGPDFVTIGRLQANLKLLPLLGKRVEVEQIILHRPEIALINDGKGATNYEFKSARAPKRLPSFRVAQTNETIDTGDIIANTLKELEEEAEKEAAGKKGADKKADPRGPKVTEEAPTGKAGQFQIGEIEIINGQVKLIDQKLNSETEIKAINLKVEAPAPESDVTAKGTVRYREDRIEIDGVMSTLQALIDGKDVKTSLRAKSERFEGSFNGAVKAADKIRFNGEADVQTFSLQNLMRWFDVDVPKQGYGGAYLRGRLSGDPSAILLEKATIKLDQATMIGDMRLVTTGQRPLLEAILRTDYLNLDPYLGQNAEIKRSSLGEGRKRAVAAWSSEKIELGFLNKMDSQIQVDAGKLQAFGHSIEKTRINGKLTAGVLTAQLPQFQLYGGSGTLNLALNANQTRPSMKSRVVLQKVQIKPLLKNSSGYDFLSGAADVTFDVVSAGQSQKEIMAALQGTGKLQVLDGAIEGINIASALRQLKKGDLSKLAGGASEKTDFSEMTGSFTIEQGVLKNQDLTMQGPLVRMSGNGIVNLAGEVIDYNLQPKLVASLRGQGGDKDLTGLSIPLRVKGPFSNPKIVPDAKGLLSGDNEKVIKDTVKQVEKTVKDLKKKKISGDEMKNLLDGMINGDQEETNELLDGILQ